MVAASAFRAAVTEAPKEMFNDECIGLKTRQAPDWRAFRLRFKT
jgi:hypothetical protein